MNLNELESRFNTEAKCRLLFENLVWPEGPVCPHCQGTKSWLISTRKIRECSSCGK